MIMIRYDLAKYIEADSKNFPGARGNFLQNIKAICLPILFVINDIFGRIFII